MKTQFTLEKLIYFFDKHTSEERKYTIIIHPTLAKKVGMGNNLVVDNYTIIVAKNDMIEKFSNSTEILIIPSQDERTFIQHDKMPTIKQIKTCFFH